MKHIVVHSLGKDLAKKTVIAAWEYYRTQYNRFSPKMDWISDTQARVEFKVNRETLRGNMSIYGDRVDLEMDVPLVFMIFKKRAIAVLEREIRSWIDRASTEKAASDE